MPNDDLLKSTATARQAAFMETFQNYGMLLNSMTPEEFAEEIGRKFPVPEQAAIMAVLLTRIMLLERK